MQQSKQSLFQPIRGSTLSSQIVHQVRDAIFSGDLKPGDPLGSEAELAKSYDVSRMSIRDALRTLEAMGIVEIRMGAGGGARIANGNPSRFADALAIQLSLIGVSEADILESQLAIECMIAELAAKNATDEEIKELHSLLEQAEAEIENSAAFTDLSMEFHKTLAVASHNQVLLSQLLALKHVVWPENSNRARPEVAQRVLKIHRKIFSKVKAKDAVGAREAMRTHLENVSRARQKADAACC